MEQAERDAEYFENWRPHYITQIGTYTRTPYIIVAGLYIVLLAITLIAISTPYFGQIAVITGLVGFSLALILLALHQVLSNPPITSHELEEELEQL